MYIEDLNDNKEGVKFNFIKRANAALILVLSLFFFGLVYGILVIEGVNIFQPQSYDVIGVKNIGQYGILFTFYTGLLIIVFLSLILLYYFIFSLFGHRYFQINMNDEKFKFEKSLFGYYYKVGEVNLDEITDIIINPPDPNSEYTETKVKFVSQDGKTIFKTRFHEKFIDKFVDTITKYMDDSIIHIDK